MLKKIGFLFLVLLLCSFVLELLLGIAFAIKDWNLEPMDIRDVPYQYYAFNEGGDAQSHGFKSSYTERKGEGNYRIILTGGSVARSKGDPAESIASKLEHTLNERLRSNFVEVVNAGVSGYVLQQEFLLIQMVLQKYDPDVIIGLDGFNDAYSIYINSKQDMELARQFGTIPPHNWRDFRMIEAHKAQRSFWSRFPGFYKNIDRTLDFLRKRPAGPMDFSMDELERIALTYQGLVGDIRDFCSSKGIRYYHFIQPARDYDQGESTSIFGEERLDEFYHLLDQHAEDHPYVFSLTGLFDDQKHLYTDYCHVNYEGNQVFAEAIADVLLPLLVQDERLFFRLPENTASGHQASE